MDSRQFFALWFWGFLHVLYAYYAERKFCHKYTHALSPVWNRPPYTRIICEKNFAPDIYEDCGAFRICVCDWLSVGILAFICIMFCICGHRLKKVGFIDWLMSNFGYKSVIKLHRFIVKMWLCICNCMCICVCIWHWLSSWFGGHQVVVGLMKSDWCSLEVGLMDSCSCICICLL